MLVLKGILYQSGNIDFLAEDNEWAFKRLASGLKAGQENQIVVRPEIASLILQRSPTVPPEEGEWLPDLEAFLNSADLVHLQKVEDRLRFRRANMEAKKDHHLIALANQGEVDAFAEKYWQRVNCFYAMRRDGFRFDLTKVLTMREKEAMRSDRIEIATRITKREGSDWPLITFDATGSSIDTRVITWRRDSEDGENARFFIDGVQVRFAVNLVKAPIIFSQEYRREFHNCGFVFAEEQVRPMMERAIRRKKKMKAQS